MTTTGLRITGLSKGFGQQAVLQHIDLDIDEGEFLILVGPSGCGKSTLLNLIAGLEQADAGEIHIAGRRVDGLSPKDRDIAMVFQNYALYPNMTVAQNLGFGLEMQRWPRAEREARVREVAEMLQIVPLLGRRPAQLSGGQRQRVAMGRALARRPKVFLFDEPLSNLDAKLRAEMRAEIKLLHQRLRTTAVYVTHDQVEAMTLGHKIAVMNNGQIQQFGTPEKIYHRPANVFVAGFMGSPAINLLPAHWMQQKDGRAVLRLVIQGLRQDWPVQDLAPGGRGAVTLGLRPENVCLAEGDAPPIGALRVIAPVLLVEPTGADTYVVVDLGQGQRLCARCTGASPARVGMPLALDLLAEGRSVFDAQSGLRLN